MPIYEIGRTTTYYDTAYIEADSEEEAIEKAHKLSASEHDPFDHGAVSDGEFMILSEANQEEFGL